ncbi:MAG: RsmB/NOP family class I SAM-dependent RNA methyltransferase [Alphaproteobacteria bacterium]|nr:RsmB/NOP family class I SAM-dependent RNA methyltransferase [Alphaproteobacteria bacterium]
MCNDRFFYVDTFRSILLEKISLSSIKNEVKESNRAFFNMLMMTGFRNLSFIKEEVLPVFVKKRIPKKQDILEYILYLGAVEILFLDTAVYAVINSYVEVAKKKNDKFGANFVNAVLRNIARNKDAILKNRKTSYFGKQFLELLKTDYTKEEIDEMQKFANIEPMLDLTYKPNKEPSFENAVKLWTGSYRLPSSTKVSSLSGFNEGDFWVQDSSSSMAVKAIGKELKNLKILDLCAAPGGKTAQLLSYGANVLAIDVSIERLEVLKENIKRLKLEKNLETKCQDATEFESNEKFDIILVDAPCSATGTFRRHPEIIHTKNLTDVKKMANLQKRILNRAKLFLHKDSLLVYATCSLSKEEGEKQIYKFLENNKDFVIKPIKIKGAEKSVTKEGFLRILPQHLEDYNGTDGFFVACLQRKN